MIAVGEHGGDGARLAAALGLPPGAVLDLSASLNPVAPDPAPVVARHLDAVGRYPEPTNATEALAAKLAVPPAQLLLTNGGAEAIALLAAELGPGRVDEPEFSLYRRHLPVTPAGEQGGQEGPRWRSNPDDPSGRLADPGDTAGVWDEAFWPLATGTWTRGDARCGATVLGSLTKVLACPGLRVGYVHSEDEALIERLRRRQPMWAVNGLACEALPDLLQTVDLPGWAAQIASLRHRLAALLSDAGLDPQPSDGNWLLVHAPGLRERLATHAILVRDCASFGLPGTVRIAVPDDKGLHRLQDALVTGGLMVCGTTSDAGKSTVTTGLCRLLARRGVKVAPFKAQNMALNSFVTPSGHEIGRAQGVQALAAQTTPEVAMNPILLKPTGERTSQIVVLGRPWAHMDAAAYQAVKPQLLSTVLDALADLRSRFDVVICEGAGSPAEINLLDHDIVNLRVAHAAGFPAIVVGDIDRGGVFAALYGTVALLPDDLRPLVKGFVINKLRGDPALLAGGPEELQRRTGVPTIAVLPYLHDVALDAEDSLALSGRRPRPLRQAAAATDTIDVAVIRLPRIANFTDLDALAIEPGVAVRMVDEPSALGDPDLLVIPGTKATVADFEWLKGRGLVTAVAGSKATTTVLGICGGYQMMGRTITDPIESVRPDPIAGAGWLPVETVFEAQKVTRQRRGRALGHRITGYQIHHGRTNSDGRANNAGASPPWAILDDAYGTGPDGAVEGRFAGTTLHGLFEEDGFRAAFLTQIATARGKTWRPSGVSFAAAREAQFDRLADVLEAHMDLAALEALLS